MVMSIKEEITALEEQINQTRGAGSKEKKAILQKKIDELKSQSVEVDGEKADSDPVAEKEEKKLVHGEDGVNLDEVVIDRTPLPTNWVKVTTEDVVEAEKNGTLIGFDPKRMLALIRG